MQALYTCIDQVNDVVQENKTVSRRRKKIDNIKHDHSGNDIQV